MNKILCVTVPHFFVMAEMFLLNDCNLGNFTTAAFIPDVSKPVEGQKEHIVVSNRLHSTTTKQVGALSHTNRAAPWRK